MSAALEIGSIVVKTRGREALQKAVIVDIIDQNFVLISGADLSKIRRRRANIRHLQPMGQKLEISKGASDEDIKKAAQKAKMAEQLKMPMELAV